MVKAPRPYKDNEKEVYGFIPNVGEFFAFIQIYYGFEYEHEFPIELLYYVCNEEFKVLPEHLSPIPLDEDKDNIIEITISVNENKIPNYGIREKGKPDRFGTLPPLI